MANDSYYRFDDDNDMNYIYSHNLQKRHRWPDNIQPHMSHKIWLRFNLIHTLGRIYTPRILLVQCIQTILHNSTYGHTGGCELRATKQLTECDGTTPSGTKHGKYDNIGIGWYARFSNYDDFHIIDCLVNDFSFLTLNVRGPSYLGLNRSISWLLMPWLLTSPGHQQPCYWLYMICRSLSYLRPDFKYLCHINVEGW